MIAAPGQGAQAPGFLSAWLELPGFADRLAAWSDLAGCDLIRCGTTAGADEITDTAIAQPLLVAAAIAAADELLPVDAVELPLLLQAERVRAATAATDSAPARNLCRFTYPPQTFDIRETSCAYDISAEVHG